MLLSDFSQTIADAYAASEKASGLAGASATTAAGVCVVERPCGVSLDSVRQNRRLMAFTASEEFAILLPGATSAEAGALAERIRAALADTDGPELPTVRVSAGIASAIAPPNVEGLLQAVDSALYAARRAGRNRIVIAPRIEAPLASGW